MFDKLKIPEAWKEYYSKYPNGLSILEALISWASQVDSMVDVMNNWTSYLDNFVQQFEFDLQVKVTETLNEWYTSGFLATIITAAIGNQFETLETQLNELEANLEVKIKQSNLLNVKAYGAVGDGVTDDTDAINAVIQLVKANNLSGIYFPQGTYLIDGNDPLDLVYYYDLGGLFIDFPTRLLLHPNAILKAKTSDKVGYAIINLKNTHDVIIEGGHIIGERYTHIGVLGEFGFGIAVRNCKNITIKNVQIRECWGDGLIVGAQDGDVSSFSENIYIENVISKNNRRQGLSVISCRNLFIENCEFSLTNGTAPQSGIDLESNVGYITNENITIKNCVFVDNVGFGIVIANTCKNVVIDGNYLTGCAIVTATSVISENVMITNNKIHLPAQLNGQGIYCIGNNKDLVIKGNFIKCPIGPLSMGIGFENQKSVIIDSNIITDCAYGIFFGGTINSTKIIITNNLFKDMRDNAIQPYLQLQQSMISNNLFYNLKGHGIQAKLDLCEVSHNIFTLGDKSGIAGNPQNCMISQNVFANMGQLAPSNIYPSIYLSEAPSDNFIFANKVRNMVAGHVGIRNEGIPTIPNIVSKNDFRYASASSVLILHPSDINDGNFTL